MKFSALVELTADESCFSVHDLMVEPSKLQALRVQLNRWAKAGKITQLRKGIYALNSPWRKTHRPDWGDLCDRMEPGTWVTGATALSHYGVIPDQSWHSISCGSRSATRDEFYRMEGKTGLLAYHKVKPLLSFGCRYEAFGRYRPSYVVMADPEKALLDWAYIFSDCLHPGWIKELRLHYPMLDKARLNRHARRFDSPRIVRFAEIISRLIDEEPEWVDITPPED